MFQDKAQPAVNGYSLNKGCPNPPGADWGSRRLARRVDAMDGIHSAVWGHLRAALRARREAVICGVAGPLHGACPFGPPAARHSLGPGTRLRTTSCIHAVVRGAPCR